MLDPHTFDSGSTPVMTPATTPRNSAPTTAEEEASALDRLKDLSVATASKLNDNVAKTKDTVGTLTEAARKIAASQASRGLELARGGFAALSGVAGAATRTFRSGARQSVVEGLDGRTFADDVCGGGEVLEIPRRAAHTQTFHLPARGTLRWEFRVEAHDLGFRLRRRTMEQGGAVEADLVDAERFAAGAGVAGEWTADAACAVVAEFDNSYSVLRSKVVRYRFRVEQPTAEDVGAARCRPDDDAGVLSGVAARHRAAAGRRDAALAKVRALKRSQDRARDIYLKAQASPPPPRPPSLLGAFDDDDAPSPVAKHERPPALGLLDLPMLNVADLDAAGDDDDDDDDGTWDLPAGAESRQPAPRALAPT
jgi:hypothetical protein